MGLDVSLHGLRADPVLSRYLGAIRSGASGISDFTREAPLREGLTKSLDYFKAIVAKEAKYAITSSPEPLMLWSNSTTVLTNRRFRQLALIILLFAVISGVFSYSRPVHQRTNCTVTLPLHLDHATGRALASPYRLTTFSSQPFSNGALSVLRICAAVNFHRTLQQTGECILGSANASPDHPSRFQRPPPELQA